MKRSLTLSLLLLLCFAYPLTAAAEPIKLTLSAGDSASLRTPVSTIINVSKSLADAKEVEVKLADGRLIAGQLTAPGLLAESNPAAKNKNARQLHFIAPALKANQTIKLTVVSVPANEKPLGAFSWNDTQGKYAELSFGSRPVLRYMYEKMDESSKERRMETYKVYHHVYDPSGKRFVTKGAGGLFPHHRGLFYGFNRISYDGGKKKADVWHCNKGESQSHESFLSKETGPVVGRHRLAIAWRGQDGAVFASEQREMTVYNVGGGLLIEFASILKSKVGDVRLDGDPQHAGFQFRASQDVPDKTKGLTYYLRPDGKDKPGGFRNWPANKQHVNLPWNTMSIVLDDQRYSCCYLDRPENPKESRYSERDYGRFGSYFEYDLTEKKPLRLNYRIWLQRGEMTVDSVNALSRAFTSPPKLSSQ